MCPITNFAKDRFSEIYKIFISIHTSEYISHRQKHDFTIKSIPPGAHAFERIRLCQQQKSGFCKKSDLFKKQVGCVHSQIVEKCV